VALGIAVNDDGIGARAGRNRHRSKRRARRVTVTGTARKAAQVPDKAVIRRGGRLTLPPNSWHIRPLPAAMRSTSGSVSAQRCPSPSAAGA